MAALVIDLGNTRWKLARCDAGEIAQVADGEYGDQSGLREQLAVYAGKVDAAWVASVQDEDISAQIERMIAEVLAIPVNQIRSTDPMPNLVSGYQKPEQLGIDRLMAMVAARALTDSAFCVVDAGTAVTIDFVDADGQHLGGFILPGSRLFRDCLLANTSIPRDSLIDEGATLGRDTPTAVALGGRYAVAGIVERFVSGSGALFGKQPVELITGGGDIDRYLPMMPLVCTRLDDLVLRGLAVVAADRGN